MGKGKYRLSVKQTQRDLEPGLYSDGGGLYLQVSKQRTKAWVFRFMISGHARKMGLGDFDRVSLADARKKAEAAHLLVVDGIDPIAARDARKAADAAGRAKALTFEACAEKYISTHASGWKSSKHADQWTSTLKTWAYPILGKVSAADVTTDDVMKVLEQAVGEEGTFWAVRTETASRVRGRIENILDWATARKLRQGDNPARWKGLIETLLPAKSQVSPVQHHPAMPYVDVPAFMGRLRGKTSVSAKALEFTILTAARTGDTTGGRWDEISEDDATWTVPGERLKGRRGARRRDHVIPLSDRAMEILRSLPREGEYLFPGATEGEPLSNAAMDQLLKGMGVSPHYATVHGMRSSFRDWGGETTAYPNEMLELALAHTVSDKVEAAYRRMDMREKRRRLMQDWANFCASAGRSAAANVVPMRGT